MMRERTPEACRAFVGFLRTPHGLPLIDELRVVVLGALLDVGLEHVFACGANALDLSLAMAHHLVADWRMELGTSGFEVVHDESSNMAKQKALWDALVSPDAPPGLVGLGARAIQYPLCVMQTAFSPSVNSAALQVADLIAGANGYPFTSAIKGAEDDYSTSLAELFTLQLPNVNVWPIPEIERWPDTPAGVHMTREREVAHFWSKAERTTDADDYCWEFRGAGKYRTFYSSAAGRKVGAHRFAWESENGPIPDGLQIDHTRGCPQEQA